MNWRPILKTIFFVFVPFALLLWGAWRAVWVLSAFIYSGYSMTQQNIKTMTQWGVNGVEFQEAYYGGLDGGWVNGKATNPFALWANGLKKFYLIPFILLSPGFWSALTIGKNDPQVIN